MGDERHRLRITPRTGQCVHHVKAARVDDNHGQRQTRLQIRTVGPARDHHVGAVSTGCVDLTHDVFKAARDDAQLGAVVVLGSNVEEQVAQAADTAGPDARAVSKISGGGAHGAVQGAETAVRSLCAAHFHFEIGNFIFEMMCARAATSLPYKSTGYMRWRRWPASCCMGPTFLEPT